MLDDYHAENKTVETWLLYPEQASEEVQDLITTIERALPLHLQVFLQLRRKYRHCRGRKGWVKQIQSELPEVLAYRTGVSEEYFWREGRNTFLSWWRKITEITARMAIRRGLL